MVQLDRNDFVFDEAGGRGTPAASFFKRLGKVGHHSGGHNSNSSLELAQDSRVIGASFSHVDGIREQVTPQSQTLSRQKIKEFLDLDDDWDADIDRNLAYSDNTAGLSSINSRNGSDTSLPSSQPLVESYVEELLRDPANSIYDMTATNIAPSPSPVPTSSSAAATGAPGIRSSLNLHRTHSTSSVGSQSNHLTPVSTSDSSLTFEKREERINRATRFAKFKRVLEAENIDLQELRDLSWSGVPEKIRPVVWQLLLGYLPTNSKRRVETLETKRRLYREDLRQVLDKGLKPAIWHQISIDVPRTNPHIKLYGYETTQKSLERVLYLWAIRNASSGYVQGINDLLTPFFQTFLSVYIAGDPESFDPGTLDKKVLNAIEADSYWCLTKLMSGILNNYVEGQPGIRDQVAKLRTIMYRTKRTLVEHLDNENVEFMQFSFRWMNCLLMREVSLKNTIRMWDSYLSMGSNGFSDFHVYVCAAFLAKWAPQLMQMEFQEIMMFLQSPPTKDWTERDIELVLSEAFLFYTMFENAAAHLR